MKSSTSKSKVQGEGDYASAKKYNEQARSFAESGKVDQAARDAAPRNAQEQDAMHQAEAEWRAHAKGGASAGHARRADADSRLAGLPALKLETDEGFGTAF